MRPNPQQVHAHISQSRPPKATHDYWIHTDGSGHKDGNGGCCAIVVAPRDDHSIHYRWFAQTGTDVFRMEFEGFLGALQMVMELQEELPRRMRSVPPQPWVWWETDRESLALSVWRHPDNQLHQESYYGRSKAPDLWARFSYYESRLQITPVWKSREETRLHKEADALAGFGRECAKKATQKILNLIIDGQTTTLAQTRKWVD